MKTKNPPTIFFTSSDGHVPDRFHGEFVIRDYSMHGYEPSSLASLLEEYLNELYEYAWENGHDSCRSSEPEKLIELRDKLRAALGFEFNTP